MGKVDLGILVDVSGRVGPVVGSNWKGISRMDIQSYWAYGCAYA